MLIIHLTHSVLNKIRGQMALYSFVVVFFVFFLFIGLSFTCLLMCSIEEFITAFLCVWQLLWFEIIVMIIS